MKRFVCGFFFNKTKTEVLLIEKKRPDWQRGLLNGVGGHIETKDEDTSISGVISTLRYETPREAMVREFQEETGIKTTHANWEEFAVLNAFHPRDEFGVREQIGEVYCLRHISNCVLVPEACFEQKTDERLVVLNLSYRTRMKLVPGLDILINMAKDENVIGASINYTQITK